MIEFENTSVYNFDNAVRGMRNPLNSWHLADSTEHCCTCTPFVMGEQDMKLATSLVKAGTDHRKFLRQIMVSVDIVAPMYWWKEFDTYKVGTVRNSCSTMHTITAKEFELSDFSCDHLNNGTTNIMETIVSILNLLRENYLREADPVRKKNHWYNIIQLLPSSYEQRSTVTLNYEVIRNMVQARKNHKLDEWSVYFTDWVRELPYADELLLD